MLPTAHPLRAAAGAGAASAAVFYLKNRAPSIGRWFRGGAAKPSVAAHDSISQHVPDVLPMPPAQKVKVALCQLAVGPNKESNITSAQVAINKAAGEGAQLVVLPEMWNCPYSNDSFPLYAEDIDGGESPSTAMLGQAARELGVTIVGGSVPERIGDKLYNTCCIFDADGSLVARHRKVHLFDIDIPGKITFKESDTLTRGDGPTVVDTAAGRLGIGICYDVRFPELAQIAAQRGAQLLVYPGAFNMTTGPLHWQLLHQARAVDNQLFVACCSPARSEDPETYQAWGHSMMIGPFAEVLAEAGHEPTTVLVDVDYAAAEQRRTNMPLNMQRRYDLYALLDKTK